MLIYLFTFNVKFKKKEDILSNHDNMLFEREQEMITKMLRGLFCNQSNVTCKDKPV